MLSQHAPAAATDQYHLSKLVLSKRCIAGPIWMESTCNLWFPPQRASNAEIQVMTPAWEAICNAPLNVRPFLCSIIPWPMHHREVCTIYLSQGQIDSAYEINSANDCEYCILPISEVCSGQCCCFCALYYHQQVHSRRSWIFTLYYIWYIFTGHYNN